MVDLSGLTCEAFREELDRVERQSAAGEVGVARTPAGDVEITLRYSGDVFEESSSKRPVGAVIAGP